MGRMDGKVALVTGAARGQGRAHAVRLAQEGAEIIALDLCDQIDTVPYAMSKESDLEATVARIEELDRRVVSRRADVRDSSQLEAAVQDGLSQFDHIDVVCANAGIFSGGLAWELTDEQFADMVDVNLTGVWRTVKAVLPSMIEAGRGGSLVLTSSTAGIKGFGSFAHYTAAKHGVVGLMKSLVNEVSQYRIRVNTVHPTGVDTDMLHNDMLHQIFRPDLETVTRDDYEEAWLTMNALPVPWVDAVDISNAVLFLASDESRYVTGTQLRVDAGFCEKVG